MQKEFNLDEIIFKIVIKQGRRNSIEETSLRRRRSNIRNLYNDKMIKFSEFRVFPRRVNIYDTGYIKCIVGCNSCATTATVGR